MNLWECWHEWRQKQRLRKTDEYDRYGREFWEREDCRLTFGWMKDWCLSYVKVAKIISPIMVFVAVCLLLNGYSNSDYANCRDGWLCFVAVVFIWLLYWEVRWLSRMMAADKYALKKCGGKNETGPAIETEK